jgi:hypothetical protein
MEQMNEEEIFLATCLERQLLPLFPQAKNKAGKLSKENLPLIADVITDIAQALISLRQNRRSKMIQESSMSPKDELSLPTFKEYGIDPTNKRVVMGLVQDLVTLDCHSPKHNILTTRMANSQSVSLVRVCSCANFDRFDRNNRQHGFVNRIMTALVPPSTTKKEVDGPLSINTTDEAVLVFLIHTGRQHPVLFKNACTHLGINVKETMDAVATFTMWSASNINYSQQREVARHLRVWYGRSMTSAEDRVKKELGCDYVGPKDVGIYIHNNVKIPWSVRCPVVLLQHYLGTVFNTGDKDRACQLTHIDCLLSLDHGQGFCRAVAVIVCRIYNQSTKTWREFQQTFILASAECAKDSGEILMGTFLPVLNTGYEQMVKHPAVHVYKRTVDEGNNKNHYVCLEGEAKEQESDVLQYTPIKLECWLAADIKQYMMNQGRENFATCWCPYCDCSHSGWQSLGHTKGRPWTIKLLNEQSEKVHAKMTSAERKGVSNKKCIFTAMDLSHNVIPVLHVGLGAGNGVEKKILPEIQASCELWTEEYIKLETKLERHKFDLKRLQIWKVDENKKIITQKRGETRQILTEQQEKEQSIVKKKIELLNNLIDENKKETVIVKKGFLEEGKKDRNSKAQGQPVKAAVEGVFMANGVSKAVYFGGELQGKAVRRMMESRAVIITSIKDLILELPDEQKLIKEARVFVMLDVYERLLGHLDGLFSLCRVRRFHVTAEQIELAGKHCIQVLALWRALGMSVTIKLHIIEDHLMDYLIAMKGFGDLTEDEGERAHQIGKQDEYRSKSAVDQAAKANSHAQWESMGKREEVIRRKDEVHQALKRKRVIDLGKVNAEKKKEDRDERRANLFDLELVPQRYETLVNERKRKLVESGPVRTRDPIDVNFKIE